MEDEEFYRYLDKLPGTSCKSLSYEQDPVSPWLIIVSVSLPILGILFFIGRGLGVY